MSKRVCEGCGQEKRRKEFRYNAAGKYRCQSCIFRPPHKHCLGVCKRCGARALTPIIMALCKTCLDEARQAAKTQRFLG